MKYEVIEGVLGKENRGDVLHMYIFEGKKRRAVIVAKSRPAAVKHWQEYGEGKGQYSIKKVYGILATGWEGLVMVSENCI